MRKTKSKKGKNKDLKTSLLSYDCACLRIDTKMITLFVEKTDFIFWNMYFFVERLSTERKWFSGELCIFFS